MKQQTKGGALHKVWQALPWLWMAAAYLFDLWYQLVPGKWIVDSDLASEMILSDLLNKEGTIISHNWFYSTELKVVNLQWFYRLGLLIFPNDWHLARTFGMAITLALFAAAMLFFVKCAGLGRAGLWMVGTLLWPFGQHYLVYAIYGGYYLVYTFFYMLVLALVLRSLNADKKHCALQWVLACVITAVAGMNGVKQLMVFHAPLCLAAAILLVLALHSCGKTDWKAALDVCRKEVRLLAASLVTAVAAAAGYFVSNAVLSRMYDFKSYNFIVWNRDEDWFTLDRILMDFFHEFGYENGSGVFHFGGIAAAVGLLLGCWMFFCIVRLLLRLDKLERNDKLLVLLLVAMLAVCGVAGTALSPAGWRGHIIGAVCVSVPMFLLCLAIDGAFGGGDIKLMAAAGLFLGWQNTLLAMFFGILGGGVYGMYLLAAKKADKKDHFAFGPFLCAGIVLAMLFGEPVLGWYCQFL